MIDPTNHRTMSERSYHGAKSRSYLDLLPDREILLYTGVGQLYFSTPEGITFTYKCNRI